ncbi:MAG: helicase HerA-like domain-containing protein [Deltaproteobacteria bacterium]
MSNQEVSNAHRSDVMTTRNFHLGGARAIDGTGQSQPLSLPAHHFTTHSVIVGMTGSGKTGLAMALVEEALRSKMPVLMIDVKGDIPNLFYAFPSFAATEFERHLDPDVVARDGHTVAQAASELAAQRADGLSRWRLTESDAGAFREGFAPASDHAGHDRGRVAARAVVPRDPVAPVADRRRGRAGADGKTPAVILSVAHLDDEERAMVLGLLFEELLAWVRTLPGTTDLRAMIVFDEVFGFLPPHPANPPAKRPLIALMKQARAFGVGMVLATQNPMDLDYRALSNAGLWFVGRLQTDADRERVVEGLAGLEGGEGVDASDLGAKLKMLSPRWFVMRDMHRTPPAALDQTRWTFTWMRGPMTRAEIRKLREPVAKRGSALRASASDCSVPAAG